MSGKRKSRSVSNDASFDLSTVPFNAGAHAISAQAKANGYWPSEKSDTVSYSVYSVSCVVTNGSAQYFETIHQNKSETITIVPDAGYTYPADQSAFTVANATISSYDNQTGELVIESATGNVTVSVTCPADA